MIKLAYKTPLLAGALIFGSLTAWAEAPSQAITRVWLTHRSNDPSHIVVNWTSPEPGPSLVRYGTSSDDMAEVRVEGSRTLHHVEIPIPRRDAAYHYSVATGADRSAEATFKGYPTEVLRVAVVADWQQKPDLAALIKDDVHLLTTGGDNIPGLHPAKKNAARTRVVAYEQLIDAYPALFRSTPFLPVLGNHDKEYRVRGDKPPAEPVYDLEASAFRSFFALPDDGRTWRFDVDDFKLRLIGLDVNHIGDMGTTWQACRPIDADSEILAWYRSQMKNASGRFVVTLHNERNSRLMGQADGEWGRLMGLGTTAVTGFGYFAQRSEIQGGTYYNVSLRNKDDSKPEPGSKYLDKGGVYLLLTARRSPPQLTAEIKRLDGSVVDAHDFTIPAR
ncbi:metallophosphoesterase family protein [Paludisphaera rhizosphaerae]|uniref:metallophosphoesterase family protein n=1 Tax=Paludisphaera rhizosphaerae TaxID=2711216 RepID=UPI0013ECE0E4|nr:metallophosphoesterase [Paludisphaera rhizosphaerae]